MPAAVMEQRARISLSVRGSEVQISITPCEIHGDDVTMRMLLSAAATLAQNPSSVPFSMLAEQYGLVDLRVDITALQKLTDIPLESSQ